MPHTIIKAFFKWKSNLEHVEIKIDKALKQDGALAVKLKTTSTLQTYLSLIARYTYVWLLCGSGV